ncbi:MAG: hypothetical protein ACI9Q9_001261, partial [Flavobacterium sp.]
SRRLFYKFRDGIVLTEYCNTRKFKLDVYEAQFFANGADTRTVGLDLFFDWN